MAKNTDVPGGVIGLLVAIIAFLIFIIGNLFAPSVPTSSNANANIPIQNASLTSPAGIQGAAGANLQNAAVVQPGKLDQVNL